MSSSSLNSSKATARYLVIKHGALGDIIQAIDAFASLRASFPEAEIHLLTTAPFEKLVQMMPYFDAIHLDPRAGLSQPAALYRLYQLLNQPWDKVIDLQNSGRTKRYQRFLAPKSTWVSSHKGAVHQMPDFTGINNVERMLIAVRAVGASDHTPDLAFLADGTLPEHLTSQLNRPYALLIPGCSLAKPSKRWPSAHYARLATLLLKQGIQPVLIGTKADQAAINALASAVPEALNWMGQTSLTDLMILAHGAVLSVGNDTGPTFVAARAGQPVVMVMGADTDPSMSAPKGAKAGYLKEDAIASVQPEAVLEKARELGLARP